MSTPLHSLSHTNNSTPDDAATPAIAAAAISSPPPAAAVAPSSAADASRKSSSASSSDEEHDAQNPEERQATERDVAALLAQVKEEMGRAATPDAAHHAADGDASEGHAKDEAEEAEDKVHLSDHLNLQGLTLSDKDDAELSASAANSASATPVTTFNAAIAGSSSAPSSAGPPSSAAVASASAAALSALPPVELKDGGNASLPAPAAGEHLGAKANFFDVRVAVVGNVDSGKSTLIGVLCGGQLDNGRGLARSKVFIHAHELGTGRTSAMSQHLMGFDAQGNPVHQTVAASAQPAAKSKSWAQVVHSSRSIMTFIDLAGHEKYLKTTIAGLTGSHPDFALVIINSLAGVTRMTREHLGVCLALEIPLICVVTKVDLAPNTVLEQSKKQLFRILKSSAANKLPIQMRNEKDIETVISNSENSNKICPVFFISAVNGTHVGLLTSYLSRLRPHHEWLSQYAANLGPSAGGPASSSSSSNPTAVEFSIDEVFNVSGIGIVVSGTLSSGTLVPNSTLLLGPQSDGSFVAVLVRSLHYKRVNCASVEAGQSCAVSIRAVRKKEQLKRNLIRRGQVLVDPLLNPHATRVFDAEVLILHHPTTIKLGYQAVLHCGMIRQTAQIIRIQKECLRTGDKSICRFRFLLRDEYLHTGASFVFREGSTKGIGKVVRIAFTDAERAEMDEEERARRKPTGKSQMPSMKDKTASAAAAAATSAEKPAAAQGEAGPAAAAAADSSSSATAAPAPAAAAASGAGGAGGAGGGAGGRQKWSMREKVEYQKAKATGGGGGASAGGADGKEPHHAKGDKAAKEHHKDSHRKDHK